MAGRKIEALSIVLESHQFFEISDRGVGESDAQDLRASRRIVESSSLQRTGLLLQNIQGELRNLLQTHRSPTHL
mgnify:CR=1 FL=1